LKDREDDCSIRRVLHSRVAGRRPWSGDGNEGAEPQRCQTSVVDEDAAGREPSWWAPTEQNRRAVTAETLVELAPGHPLYGCDFELVRRCGACDEVLVRVGEDDFGLVHLTWSGKRERPPYPRYAHTGSFVATETSLDAHSAEHGFK